MRSIPFPAVLVIFFMLITLAVLVPLTMTAGPAKGDEGPEAVLVRMNFDDGSNGDLTPLSVEHEDVELVTMYGNPPPIPAFLVGRWTTKALNTPLSIYGSFSCSLWADSQDNARNAYFVIEVYRGSTRMVQLNTSKQDLTTSPVKFMVNEDLNIEMQAGETLSVRIYFRSDMVIRSGALFPQPARATFYFGGGVYNSGISVTCNPITIEIIEPTVEQNVGTIDFSARVNEAFDIDPASMNFSLTIIPPAGVKMKHLSEVEVTDTDEGLVFVTDWTYGKDKGVDGDYTVTMEVTYDNNFTYSNTTKFTLDLPKKTVTDISETPLEPLIIVGAVAGVGIVAWAVYMNRRKLFRKGKKGGKPTKGKKDADVKKKGRPTKGKKGGSKKRS